MVAKQAATPFAELAEAIPITSLVLKFSCIDPQLRAETIARFRAEVLPQPAAARVVAHGSITFKRHRIYPMSQ
ncbi:MAG: hypothetical protein WCF20_03460 [Methylovirgula sp.]